MSAGTAEEMVTVGVVAKPHGVKGELAVISHAGSPGIFAGLETVWLKPPSGRPRRFGLRACRPHKDRVLLVLAGVTDRDEAEKWRRAEVLAKRDDLPPPQEDEVFLFELQGWAVALDDGTDLGTITDVMVWPAEVWTITTPQGREVLFPVAEEFVTGVDAEAGRVRISPPPGLLELYLDLE
jgi:16S rRNA processing protein RimM